MAAGTAPNFGDSTVSNDPEQPTLNFGFVVVPSPKKVAAYQLDAIANVMKT